MLLTLLVHSGRRYGQSLLFDTGGVGLGLANKEREGKRRRERGRGDAKQALDSVSVGVKVEPLNFIAVELTDSISLSPSLSAHYIILLVESVLFGVFVMVIFYDQVHTFMHHS